MLPRSPDDEPFGCEVGATCPLEQHLPWTPAELAERLAEASPEVREKFERGVVELAAHTESVVAAMVERLGPDHPAVQHAERALGAASMGRDLLVHSELKAERDADERKAKVLRAELPKFKRDQRPAVEAEILESETNRRSIEDQLIELAERYAAALFPERTQTLHEEVVANWQSFTERHGTSWYRPPEVRRPAALVEGRLEDLCCFRLRQAVEGDDVPFDAHFRYWAKEVLGPIELCGLVAAQQRGDLRALSSGLGRVSEANRRQVNGPVYLHLHARMAINGEARIVASLRPNSRFRLQSCGRRRVVGRWLRRNGKRDRGSRGRPVRFSGSRRVSSRSAGGGGSGDPPDSDSSEPALGRLYDPTGAPTREQPPLAVAA